MNGIPTHEYKEVIQIRTTYKKVGEVSLFWGLIKAPKGVITEKKIHTGLCERCGKREFTSIHGYHNLTNP